MSYAEGKEKQKEENQHKLWLNEEKEQCLVTRTACRAEADLQGGGRERTRDI